MSTDRSHLASVVVALFVTLLWSSSWVLIRWGFDKESLDPLTFAALRYGIASAVMIVWVLSKRTYRRQVASMNRRLALRIVVLGIVFYALTQGSIFVALDNQPAATTSLMLALTPLFVGMLAGTSLRESSSARQIWGTILVAGGAWMYFTGGLGATAIGMVAAIVALGGSVMICAVIFQIFDGLGIVYNAGSLLGRQVNRRAETSPVVITAISMTVGSVLLASVGLASEGVPTVTPTAWLIILWLAVVNTALAFTLWNLSLRRLSALESAGINNTMLVQIAVLAWIFLGERPGASGFAGIILVSIGVLLTQKYSGAARS